MRTLDVIVYLFSANQLSSAPKVAEYKNWTEGHVAPYGILVLTFGLQQQPLQEHKVLSFIVKRQVYAFPQNYIVKYAEPFLVQVWMEFKVHSHPRGKTG